MTIPPHAHGPSCGRNAEKFTLVAACPFKAADDLVVFRDLLLDGKDDVRKTHTHGPNRAFETIESGPLSPHRYTLNHIFPDIFLGRFDLSFCNHFVYKFADDRRIVLRHLLPSLAQPGIISGRRAGLASVDRCCVALIESDGVGAGRYLDSLRP